MAPIEGERSKPLNMASLRDAYSSGATGPVEVIDSVVAAISACPDEGIWTHVRDAEELRAEARELERRRTREALPPLYGVPFAVKDSIDVAGIPTTVACPDFAYVAEGSAVVVDRLRAAGAVFVGKTNLDQFATGLVGTRSPFGIPPNSFDPRYVTGGSSSGAAAAVARGQVSFALATDTAGSGRVPAAFNNIVGLKPSRGLFSTTGLVPACRSIDCMTLLTLTCEDARDVAAVATAFDPGDPFSRPGAAEFSWASGGATGPMRLGVPRDEDLVFDDEPTALAFGRACETLRALGATLEPVRMRPFYDAGALLYGGPWIAERLAGIEPFFRANPESLLPVIRMILAEGERYRATDAFRGMHLLAELKREIEPLWSRIDALLVPTAPSHPRIEEVMAEPLERNFRLGRYTTFANLLDLAAVAVPAGFREDGLPSGITFLGPWGSDAALLTLASTFHRMTEVPLGATTWRQPASTSARPTTPSNTLRLAVVGAHLAGQPLNHQLVDRGASLVRATRTAPDYKLFALPGTRPPKPGLLRVAKGGGAAIDVEVWAMPMEAVGSFLALVPAPLTLGTIDLEEGPAVHGFLCEAHAASGAEDITSFGGWRAYIGRIGA
jgi:allophanate hydrolase